MKILKAIRKFAGCVFWPLRRKKELNVRGGHAKSETPKSSQEIVSPPAPKDGEVRLYSAFSQEIYSDIAVNQFCEVPVNVTGLQESNHFLLSLWNEMNLSLHPDQIEYVPWHYRPDIIETNAKWKLILLGDTHTSFGNFHLMLRMKDKQTIMSLLAFNSMMDKKDYETLFAELVGKAKKHVNNLKSFTSSVRLLCKNYDANSSNVYSGKNFYFRSDERGICIDIRVHAIDYIEAKQQIAKRLEVFVSFLAVETNLLFFVNGDWDVKEDIAEFPVVIDKDYIKPYIDGPSIRDSSIMLSQAGEKFLDRFVFVDRDISEGDVVLYFKRSCTHVFEGLQKQLEKGDIMGYTTQTQAFILAPKNNLRSQNIITMSAMSYLSALETASTPEGQPETCPTCGNVAYKISARVESFVSRYVSPEVGREFKELYNLRSKYLHAGKLSCDNFFITARPFIDPSTGSGLTDYGFISCRVNGKLMVIGVHNIQELTTYVLRCYYQDKLFGVTDFDTVEEHSKDINVKQKIIDKIQEALPRGVVVKDITT